MNCQNASTKCDKWQMNYHIMYQISSIGLIANRLLMCTFAKKSSCNFMETLLVFGIDVCSWDLSRTGNEFFFVQLRS